MNEAEESTIISVCVFNALTSYTAIALNIVTIIALRKAVLLPKPLKTLLLSLVVSDLGVGLLIQPSFIALNVMVLKHNTANNPIRYAYPIMLHLLCCASFLGVTALSADRFLAIHLHLRYQELVTHKRVVAGVISIWVFSASFSLLIKYWTVPMQTYFAVMFTILTVCLVSTAMIYIKLYLVVRHHLNPIHAQQEQVVAQVGELENSARQRKSAVATFFVYVVFLVCYLPNACIMVFMISKQGNLPTMSLAGTLSDTLMFLNSSLNPLVYCWKMRHIRHTIMDILRNIFNK